MESAPRPGNSGISSVIAVALLLAMVVLCASIVSLLVLQSVQDAAPETLHAQFQASADTHRLYLTGGDVLPIADLTFYDADGNVISGSVTFPNGKTGTNGNSGVWTPGEYVTVTPDSDVIGSIVAKSVNGNSVLVYRASESLASLPIGDMVPDWFTIPTISQGGNTGGGGNLPIPPSDDDNKNFEGNDGVAGSINSFKFGNLVLFEKQGNAGNLILPSPNVHNYSAPSTTISVTMNPQSSAKFSSSRLTVRIYNATGSLIPDPQNQWVAKEENKNKPLEISVGNQNLLKGYTVYVRLEKYIDTTNVDWENPDAWVTMIIKIT